MELTNTPETYVPSIDSDGNYVDCVPKIKNGLYCPCGSRKDKVYENATKFTSHIKSQSHKKWIATLNQNKANYYKEMILNKELLENQKKIIMRLENELKNKDVVINFLSEQMRLSKNSQNGTIDLLDFSS